jgi:hypothetical protein
VDLEFDRAHFGAVLLVLATPLPVFIVVELALNAGGLFVEEIGEMPEKIVEVGFDARVPKSPAKNVEHVRDRAFEAVCPGKRARVGLGC